MSEPNANQEHAMTHPDTARVLTDIATERERQVTLGWTRDHDDRHNVHELVRLADRQAHKTGTAAIGIYSRERLVEAAALLVAAVEGMDRREAKRDE